MLPHISYSQYNSYTSCPRSWYLSRLKGGEERQTWYIPIGTAVHNMVEEYLSNDHSNMYSFPAEDYFYPLIERQMEIEPDLSKWLAGGPEAAPITHDRALQRVSDCFEKAVQELEAIDVWEVEYDASGSLPGLEVPIKAYIDIIGEHKKKGPVIWDWKTGSTKPGNFQLKTYAALLKTSEYGRRVKVDGWQGRYIMLSPTYTSTTRHVDLSEVDPAEIGAEYQAVYNQMKAKVYRADAGFNCKFCFQAENCKVNKGTNPRTEYYDRSDEDGYPY